MNAPFPHQRAEREALHADLRIRLMMSAVLNGQFDGIPLGFYTKLDWIDVAQWLDDVTGEPEDEAQAIAEIDLMLVKSDYFDRWMNLSERAQGDWAFSFGNYWEAQRERQLAREHLAAMPTERRQQLEREWRA